ncbi:MAG: DNA-binding protein WhiA [Actinobacteria bacterium]|nr:DNA-binding protein WhiA [Actinomycetota bacterium]
MTSTLQKAKEELAHYKGNRRCCQLAELSALLHMDGKYGVRGREGNFLVTESSSAYTARKIYTLMHSLFDVETSMVKVERSSPRKGNVYKLEVTEQPGFHQMLNELGVLDSSLSPEPWVPKRLAGRECCLAAVLRGAFLGGGYISEPYGLADFEISLSSKAAALACEELFNKKGLRPGIRKRRNQWVLYLKKREQISDFLAITGAHSTHLEWESQTIMNSTRNRVNRLVNCDTSNARRLSEASLRQREAIKEIKALGLLEMANPKLIELAEARLTYPQASLAELGMLLNTPVSKATVQGRMRRLESLTSSVD